MSNYNVYIESYEVAKFGLHHKIVFDFDGESTFTFDGGAFNRKTGGGSASALQNDTHMLQTFIGVDDVTIFNDVDPKTTTLITSTDDIEAFTKLFKIATDTALEINDQNHGYRIFERNSNSVAYTIVKAMQNQPYLEIDLKDFHNIKGGWAPGRKNFLLDDDWLSDKANTVLTVEDLNELEETLLHLTPLQVIEDVANKKTTAPEKDDRGAFNNSFLKAHDHIAHNNHVIKPDKPNIDIAYNT